MIIHTLLHCNWIYLKNTTIFYYMFTTKKVTFLSKPTFKKVAWPYDFLKSLLNTIRRQQFEKHYSNGFVINMFFLYFSICLFSCLIQQSAGPYLLHYFPGKMIFNWCLKWRYMLNTCKLFFRYCISLLVLVAACNLPILTIQFHRYRLSLRATFDWYNRKIFRKKCITLVLSPDV